MSDDVPPEPSIAEPGPTPPPKDDDFAPLPMGHGFGGVLSALLQRPGQLIYQLHTSHSGMLILALTAIAIVCFFLFGLLVGDFSRGVQLWAAPVKITLGGILSAVICFPSLYVFTCLAGASDRMRLGGLVGLLAGALALEGLLLVSFAPVAWVFSESTESVVFIGFLYLILWSVATYFGVRFLHVGTVFLGTAGRGYLNVWVVIFVLVNLQMMTAVRPLVGTSPQLLPTEKKFFIAHWFEMIRDDARARGGPMPWSGGRREVDDRYPAAR